MRKSLSYNSERPSGGSDRRRRAGTRGRRRAIEARAYCATYESGVTVWGLHTRIYASTQLSTRIWGVFNSFLESDEILKLPRQSFCGRLRCASPSEPGNDTTANKVTLNVKKFESAMKAPEDRAPGPGPAHWTVDTAQVHCTHFFHLHLRLTK
jgi:hypothetical protein